MANESKLDVYIIPENFIEGGRIFNGMFKTRNFIEAAVLSLIVGVPLWMIPYPSITVKLSVVSIFVVPIFLIAVTGINDGSFIEFLQQFMKWKKSKRVMLYNGQTQSRAVRPADVIDAQEMPKDKFVQTVNDWKDKRKAKSSQTSFVEGVDFVFKEDSDDSYFIAAEKKILNQSENVQSDADTKKRKKSKKVKKQKTLLLENNPKTDIGSTTKIEEKSTEVDENCEVIVIDNDDTSNSNLHESQKIAHLAENDIEFSKEAFSNEE